MTQEKLGKSEVFENSGLGEGGLNEISAKKAKEQEDAAVAARKAE